MNFRNQKLSSAQLCGIAAIACPLLALLAIAFDHYRHAPFWKDLNLTDDADQNAAVMMAAGEGILASMVLLVGCFIGLGLSFFSLMKQANKFGMVALATNALPFLLFFCVLLKDWFTK